MISLSLSVPKIAEMWDMGLYEIIISFMCLNEENLARRHEPWVPRVDVRSAVIKKAFRLSSCTTLPHHDNSPNAVEVLSGCIIRVLA